LLYGQRILPVDGALSQRPWASFQAEIGHRRRDLMIASHGTGARIGRNGDYAQRRHIIPTGVQVLNPFSPRIPPKPFHPLPPVNAMALLVQGPCPTRSTVYGHQDDIPETCLKDFGAKAQPREEASLSGHLHPDPPAEPPWKNGTAPPACDRAPHPQPAQRPPQRPRHPATRAAARHRQRGCHQVDHRPHPTWADRPA